MSESNASKVTPTVADGDAGQTQPASQSRRRFLGNMGLSAGALLSTGSASVLAQAGKDTAPLPVPPSNKMLGRGVVSVPYGLPSKFEAEVLRRNVDWLTPDRIASISFTPLQDLHGIITPSGLHFERYHSGAIDIDPDNHLLVIHGMVGKPIKLTLKELKRLPSHTAVHFLECPANGAMEWRGVQMDSVQFTHGMVSCSEWTGVKLTTLMQMVGVKPEATWFYAEGADGYPKMLGAPMDEFIQAAVDGEDNVSIRGINNLWAHAPTLYDYIRRAMPFFAPQSLTDAQAYSVTGYVLSLAEITDGDVEEIDAAYLKSIKMPSADNFYTDPRPDIRNVRCMQNCYDYVPDIKGNAVQGDISVGAVTKREKS